MRVRLPVRGGPGHADQLGGRVGADRAYFDTVVADGGEDAAMLRDPVYCPRRRFRLSGREARIGRRSVSRRSVSRGIEPEIDLAGPPTDPGVSRLHAVLVPGDIIHPGAWTAIQIFDARY